MKYHIVTYGCQMNKSDSERLAAKLERRKYQPGDIKSADLVVINICSVRQSAIDRVYAKIRQLNKQKPKPRIVLTGCILEKDKKILKNQVNDIWPIADFKEKAKCFSEREAFVPIMTGCDNFCSYCAVPYARGREKSRKSNQIIKEVKGLIKKDYKKIILLGQNVNSYKSESGIRNQESSINFPKLLKTIDSLEGNFKIEFMTSHPKDFSDGLINVISESKKISKQIHLPIQSGDNVILKKMNRGYTVGHYRKLIKKIRKRIPDVKISTDIIVGFPTETEKQFQNSVKLVKEMNFCQIYVSAYSPRIGTLAAKLKDNISPNEKKRRKRIILDMIK